MNQFTVTYLRFSGFYFWYFAFVGAFAPYFALYLQWRGLDPVQIAALLAVGPLSRIYGPNLWGWLADRSRRRQWVLRWLSVLTAGVFCAVFLRPGYAGMLLLLVALNFFLSGVLPLAEATTLGQLGERLGSYGRIRVWGSIGFIVTVFLGGRLLDVTGIQAFEPLTFGLLVVTAAATALLPVDHSVQRRPASAPFREALSKPGVVPLLAGLFLMQAAHGPYNAFYSVYLVQLGYTKTMVGGLWALGVVAEIVLFVYLPTVLARWSLHRILWASVAIAVMRFLLIGLAAQSLFVLGCAQLMHAATFGAFHAAAIAAMHRTFGERSQAQGQALYTSLGYGLGASLGTLGAGYSWERVGGAATFVLAAVVAAAALFAFRRAASALR